MNDKTAQSMADALIDQIESAARASFRRHQSSIKGQILTAADNYDWHLLHAAYHVGIDTLRAQLAEAQKDAERYDYLRKHSTFFDPSQNDTSFLREPPRRIWYHETPHIGADTLDAAIDAAREKANG